eukprot:jgi/Botrbrau1/7781/Bobra.0159s0209.1
MDPPQTDKAVRDAQQTYKVDFEAVVNMLPTGVYSFWTTVAALVTGPSAVCVDETRKMVLWITFAVMVPVSGLLAILDRHKDLPYGKPYWPDAVRALGANLIFAGLALLTPPGSSCLLAGSTPGSSILPDYAPQIFVIVVYSLSVVLSQYGKELCARPQGQSPPRGTGGTPAQEPLLGTSTQSSAHAADAIA